MNVSPSPLVIYGGKTRMLQHILPMIPAHTVYDEPYAGGLTVLFAKDRAPIESASDIDGRIIRFWRVMKSNELFAQFMHHIDARGGLLHEGVYWDATRICRAPDQHSDLEVAWATWVAFAQAHTAKLDSGWSFLRNQGSHASGLAAEYRRKIQKLTSAICRRVAHVQFFIRPALEQIRAMDGPECFHFVDPPYPDSDQGHYKGFTHEDMQALIETLRDCTGRWMLTCYDYDYLREAAQANAWTQRRHEMYIHAGESMQNRRKSRKTEVITMNYDPAQSRAQLNLFV